MTKFYKLISFLFLSSFHIAFAQEICTNGIDDDGDGLIDLNDPDCVCTGATPNSLIYNHSFENINCCPSTYGDFPCIGPILTGNVFDPSSGSPDLFNTCDWTHFMGQVGLLPFPDGNGAAGFFATTDYREHIGGCLMNTLTAGTNYTFQFSFASTGTTVNPSNGENEPCPLNFFIDTVFMELYGSPSCPSLYNGYTCPTVGIPGSVLLGTAAVSLNTQGYQTVTMNFTPTINVDQVILQFPCSLPAGWHDLSTKGSPGFCSPYAVVDNLILNTTSSFSGVAINMQGDVCTNDLTLVANTAQPGTFQWYSGGVAIVGQTNSTLGVSALNLPTGMYQVLYDDGTSCGIDSIFVDNSASTNTLLASDVSVCLGEPAQLNAQGATSYSWSNSSGDILSSTDSLNVSPSITTNYTVVGTFANGCLDSLNVTVNVFTLPNDVEVSISPIPVETEATLSLSPANYAYTWIAPDSSVSTGNSLSYEFPLGEGSYSFSINAVNANGCTYDLVVPIEISSDLLIYVPNAFTPDGNEYNDIFKPIISDKLNKNAYSFKIYNRWGEVLFESRNLDIGWDGTYRQRKVPSGIYSWSIDLEVKNVDEPQQYTGHVNVLR